MPATAIDHTPPARSERLESEQELEQGWKRIDAPQLFSFEKPGDFIAGILISITTVNLNGKKVSQYVLTQDEKIFKLLGTYDLVQKLTPAHRGCMVRIKYRGTDPTISKNGNAMRVFDVLIKGTPTPISAGAGFTATDEDIPF